jgi:phospholipase C
MLENRSFDHLFGFFPPPEGEKIEDILAIGSPPVNLLDHTKPKSTRNPAFEVSQPAPLAVDKPPFFAFDRIGLRAHGHRFVLDREG